MANSVSPGQTAPEGWLISCPGLTALSDSISVYIASSPREREKKEK